MHAQRLQHQCFSRPSSWFCNHLDEPNSMVCQLLLIQDWCHPLLLLLLLVVQHLEQLNEALLLVGVLIHHQLYMMYMLNVLLHLLNVLLLLLLLLLVPMRCTRCCCYCCKCSIKCRLKPVVLVPVCLCSS